MRISFFAAAAIAATSASAYKIDPDSQCDAQLDAEEDDQFASYAAKVLGTAGYKTLMDKEVQKCIMEGASHVFHAVTGHEDIDDENFDEWGFGGMISSISHGVSSLANSANHMAHSAYDSAHHLVDKVEDADFVALGKLVSQLWQRQETQVGLDNKLQLPEYV